MSFLVVVICLRTMSSLRQNFTKALLSVSLATGAAAVQASEDTPILQPTTSGPHTIYAHPDVVRKLGPLTESLTRIAGQDLVFLDPSHFPKVKLQEWAANPVVQNLWNEKIARYGNASFFVQPDIPLQTERLLNDFKDEAKQTAGGANFVSSNIGDGSGKKGCFIFGDPDGDPLHVAKVTGNIPESLTTAGFRQKFSSKASVLFFSLAHEAAHCPQNYIEREKAGPEGSIASHQAHLIFEIDADQNAQAAYNGAVAAQPEMNLDPDMPRKMDALRHLAPFLAQGEASAGYISHFIKFLSHSTGFAASEPDLRRRAELAVSDTIELNFLLRGNIYDVATERLQTKPGRIQDQLAYLWGEIQNQPESLYYAAKALKEARAKGNILLSSRATTSLESFIAAWDLLDLKKDTQDEAVYKGTFDRIVVRNQQSSGTGGVSGAISRLSPN